VTGDVGFPTIRAPLDAEEWRETRLGLSLEAYSAGIPLPGGVRGWSERSTNAKRPFGPPWSGIAGAGPRRHWQRTPVVQCNRGPCTAPNALAACFLLIAVAILVARKLAQYDGGMAEEETWRKIVNVSGFLQC